MKLQPSNALLVSQSFTLREVLIEFSAPGKPYCGLCIILNDSESLFGVITDADLIRLVSSNVNLDDPVELYAQTNPVTAPYGLSLEETLEYIQQQINQRSNLSGRLVRYVPLINSKREVCELLDIYLMASTTQPKRQQVEIYGLGFVGLTLAAKLASLNFNIYGIDCNPDLIHKILNCQPTIHEPGLNSLLSRVLSSKSLTVSTSPPSSANSQVFIIAVGTPINPETQNVDTKALDSTLDQIGLRIQKGDLVMLRSTVPVGLTRERVIPRLENVSNLKAGLDFFVAFTPERTVEGKALEELSSLPQIVGGLTRKCTLLATSFWSNVSSHIVQLETLESSELVKLINNSYRDLRFAFANSFALLADKYNIDAFKVIEAANDGYPRDQIALPSPGVGGYCLTKDPLLYSSNHPDMPHAILSRFARSANTKMTEYPIELLNRFSLFIHKQTKNLNVLIAGVAFKGTPETNDLRGSTSIEVALTLLNMGCNVYAYDAVISHTDIRSYGLNPVDLIEGANYCDAVLLLNNHPSHIDDNLLVTMNSHQSLLFDGWHQYSKSDVDLYPNIIYSTLGNINLA